jgi:magnesium transporter
MVASERASLVHLSPTRQALINLQFAYLQLFILHPPDGLILIMSHPLFTPEVRYMLAENQLESLRTFCETLHPATVADALADEFSPEEVWKIMSLAGIREQAAIFEYFSSEWQVAMVAGTGQPNVARLIEKMSHDDRVDLMRRLSPRVADGLLRLVDDADRKDIAALLRNAEGTVGALMTTDYAWVPQNLLAGEAIDRLRQQAPDRETIYYIYVLDESSRRLIGIVSLRDLILSARNVSLSELMETELQFLRASDDKEKAVQELARYDFLALPVVDDQGRLVGIVTHDDVIDVLQDEATEDLQRQAGVGPIGPNYLEAPFVTVWYNRAIWLALLFLAQMFTFEAMSFFDDAMKAIFVLSMLVPLCISCGGNAGSQAATLVTRALALGQINVRDWWHVVRREVLIGIALGATLGILGLMRTWFLTPERVLTNSDGTQTDLMFLSISIAMSVAVICLWGTLVGSCLPIVFKKFGVDPAIAASPFIATLSDVSGIIIYFNVARWWLM